MNTLPVARLCAVFHLGEPTETEPQVVPGGVLHRIWRLATTHGIFAVKQLNPAFMQKPRVRDVYRLTERVAKEMAAKGIPAVVAIDSNSIGGTLGDIDGASFIVYDWVEGEKLPLGPTEPERAQRIGEILARMHSLNLQISELKPLEWETFSEDEWDMLTFHAADRGIPWAHQARAALPQILLWCKRDQEAGKVLGQTLVVSHREVDQKNVLWRDATFPVLVDWEAVGFINPTMEAVGAALNWSGQPTGEVRKESFDALLEGYKSAGGVLRDAGIDAIYGFMGTWLGWMLFNMHRSLGESISSEEERLLGIQETSQTLTILRSLAENIQTWSSWVEHYR